VGGEYPLASSSAAENAEEHAELKKFRGREVILVFANQGWGNLTNCVVILGAMYLFGETGKNLHPTPSKNVIAVQYAFGACVCLFMVTYRLMYLTESEFYVKEHENTVAHDLERKNKQALEDDTQSKKDARNKYEWKRMSTLIKFYLPRQIAASGAWIANDFAFYGNKLQQAFFISIMIPKATPYDQMKYTILNSGIALCGYYCAAFVVDKPWYGRRSCQNVGFMALALLNIIIYLDWYNLSDENSSDAAKTRFQVLYYLSSFFNQVKKNRKPTTFCTENI
jgi:hypothetical protein